ncbi:MAG: carboxylating nicotinate-nucleotide diphosphorylase [Bacteroidetes bacterium]|nr:carboxylating nicotinate-nucleotide diphosphorylase [Bacteroidota bacterium]MBL0064265.1 carboxylating nicotinate-nucleotide diphosphorylase [Bacteroidota bacterium]MBL0139353.1 carboxylating nicotinate-nucleotide diphosphorylase [Bacteroidota bacterium]
MDLSQYPHYGLSVSDFIRQALLEDTGDGDHTSLSTIGQSEQGKAKVMIKENGVVAGLVVADQVLNIVDSSMVVKTLFAEGASVKSGDVVMNVEGSVRSMLKAERLLLNCMQRMSGIASLTRRYVDAVAGTGAVILDTRKTTPNFRLFEKWAVTLGGGMNHRFGLYDMILIKDNHVDASGGIKEALRKANAYLKEQGKQLKIEIETRNLEEVKQVISAGGADRIMLDNFKPEMIREAVNLINQKFETEASGGITLDNILEYAKTGVNFISVGALTHSYKSLDISMKIVK